MGVIVKSSVVCAVCVHNGYLYMPIHWGDLHLPWKDLRMPHLFPGLSYS